jgi:formylglycine-generating enzyme required for sulfatase activity
MEKSIKFKDISILGVRQRFCLIPPGKFLMGSPEGEVGRYLDEKQHEVEISKGFWMSDTVCTQALWDSVMGGNPSFFKGGERPVENVSWEDCQDFINKINNIKPWFRLPSEAEWEYACRAGTNTPFWFGENINTEQANFDGNYIYSGGKKGIFREETVPVKFFPPNGWGIYGMHGNVWEWCEDRYGEYPTDRVVDPRGPEKGDYRVVRGGSWGCCAIYVRSAFRNFGTSDFCSDYLGFRLVK